MLEGESLVQGIEIVAVDKKWQFPASRPGSGLVFCISLFLNYGCFIHT
jgi:hypothetical protein